MHTFLLLLQTILPPDSGEVRLRNIRQLTFGGQNAEAYFSADGRQLILQRQESDSGCDQQFVVNVDGTGLRRVSSGRGRTTCGYFYANDRRILYASTEHRGPACPPVPSRSQGYVWALYDYDLYTSNPDGSDLRRLTTNPLYDAEATLSPDGQTIVFTSLRDGDIDVYTMSVDGSNLRRLTDELGYDGGPFFSHDGRRIVWRRSVLVTARDSADYRALVAQNLVRPSRMEVWVMDVDGSNKRQVTDLGGANFAPYFTPDDRRIIFASNHTNPRGRNFDLFLINVDGTGLERVTTHGDFDGFPMFSPDGLHLVFASNRNGKVPGETNIFIADWIDRP
jgi:Tol biopolymer transport system component